MIPEKERPAEAGLSLLEAHRAATASTLIVNGVRTQETAFDLSQEVALKVWRHLPKLRDPQSFGGWVRRIAANAAVDHIRGLLGHFDD